MKENEIVVLGRVFPATSDKVHQNQEVYDGGGYSLHTESNALQRPTKSSHRNLEPRLLGGFGERNFGKQYRQGNRVYDSAEIAVALCAHPVGNAGGQTCLYLVRVKRHEQD